MRVIEVPNDQISTARAQRGVFGTLFASNSQIFRERGRSINQFEAGEGRRQILIVVSGLIPLTRTAYLWSGQSC
jgi:hypothetical protein